MKRIFKFNSEKLKGISSEAENAKNLSEEELVKILEDLKKIEPLTVSVSLLMILMGLLLVLWLKFEYTKGGHVPGLWGIGTMGSLLIFIGIQQIFERIDFRKNFQREHSLLYSKIVNMLNAL